MQNILMYSTNEHKSFMDEWRPHRNCNECWSFYGLLPDTQPGGSLYGFSLTIRHFQARFDAFSEVLFAFSDITRSTFWERHYLLPHVVRSKQKELIFDQNSFFCKEKIQMLVENNYLALRIQEEELSFDLCAEATTLIQWFGDSDIRILPGSKHPVALQGGWTPFMKCFAKIQPAGRSMLRLEGHAAFERMWGCYPINSAKTHWEKFYLFLDDGREMALLDFPYAQNSKGFIMHPGQEIKEMQDYSLTALDNLEIDEWRFGSSWRLDMADQQPLYLIALRKDHFKLPITRTVLGVYDQNSKQLGVCFCELMPGARNELSSIPFKTYYNYLQQQEAEIL